MNKSQKQNKINDNNQSNIIFKEKKSKQQLKVVDVIQEAQQKYRESENIAIDPEYIIEEEEKRQPLSFQE